MILLIRVSDDCEYRMSLADSFVEPRGCSLGAKLRFTSRSLHPVSNLVPHVEIRKTVNVQVKDLFYDFFFFYDFVKRFVLTFVTKYRINYPSTAMYLQVSQVVANFPTKIILCVSTLCYVGFLHA